MGKMLARADSEGTPCYLETQNEKNVKVYEKVGFEVMSSGKVDGHDLNVWTMKRTPATARGQLTGPFHQISKGA